MNMIPVPPAPVHNPIKWKLLEAVPVTNEANLVVKATHETDRHFAAQYALSAERLAGTFTSQPVDDMILLPFLTLYRQAYELALKSCIADFARWRRIFVDPGNPDLVPESVQERLKTKHSHNFHKLSKELIEHYNSLNLGEAFPTDLADLIETWHQTDRPGTSFRYASVNQPTETARIDFPALATMLDQGLRQLWAVEDWVDALMSAVPEP